MRCIVKYDQIYSNIVNYEVYVLYGIQMHEVKNDTKSGGSSHRQIFKLSQRAKTMIFIRRNDKTKEDKKTKQYMRKKRQLRILRQTEADAGGLRLTGKSRGRPLLIFL